jgi:signal transduction histidine kinase
MNIISLLLGKQYNILTYLPEAVLVIDGNGKIYYANKSAFKLFETNKLRGRNINEYFLISSDNIIKNKDEEIKQILKIVSEEQNTKITDVKVTDVSSRDNKRYILTIIDNTQDHSLLNQLITERQEQKILNHSKNTLLTKMSNYLCSPLHSVVGFSQAMLEGLSGELNEKQTKYLQIIKDNSSDILLLLAKLIDLSKVETDIYKFEYSNFDVSALLNIIINEIGVKLQGKDIKLSVNTADLLKQNCYSDKNIVKNIISNLLENAVELIQTGAIHINLSNPISEFLITKGYELNETITEKSYLMFEMTCKGLDATVYNNTDIFDPYVQVEKNSKKYLLQSLLLGSTKKYIEKLKGEIWINNHYANQVSFVFIIPIDKALIENS